MATKSKQKKNPNSIEEQSSSITETIFVDSNTVIPKDVTTLEIQDHPDLIVDLQSHAVINRDNSSYIAALESKRYRQNQRDDIQSMRQRMEKLELLISQLGNPTITTVETSTPNE